MATKADRVAVEREALALILDRRADRNRLATLLADFRRNALALNQVRPGLFSAARRREVARWDRILADRPPRARADVLRNEAKSCDEFARTRYGPIVLDDGYCCCGAEDARADHQEHARTMVPILRAAARMLSGRNNGKA